MQICTPKTAVLCCKKHQLTCAQLRHAEDDDDASRAPAEKPPEIGIDQKSTRSRNLQVTTSTNLQLLLLTMSADLVWCTVHSYSQANSQADWIGNVKQMAGTAVSHDLWQRLPSSSTRSGTPHGYVSVCLQRHSFMSTSFLKR